MICRVISGGQTGADRGALEAAIACGVPHGGWCPQGRRAEDGVIPARFALEETPSGAYPQRTAWNVRDADATLIFTRGDPEGGTLYTLQVAESGGSPVLVVDLDLHPSDEAVAAIVDWLQHAVPEKGVLNVAGPRERSCPGLEATVTGILVRVFSSLCAREV